MPGDELASRTAVDPGQVLASTREALGVTQREVSDALNLPINTVDAIERGDKSKLPAHVFTRGYVRAYAKLLEIDPDPLVAALVADPVEEKKSPLLDMQPKQSFMPADFDPQVLLQPKWLAVAGAVLLFLILLIWLLVPSSETDTPQSQATAQTAALEAANPLSESNDEPLVDSEIAARASSEMDVLEEVVDASVNDAGINDESVNNDERVAAAVLPSTEAAVASNRQSGAVDRPSVSALQTQPTYSAVSQVSVTDEIRRLTPTGDDRLSLAFTEDCWVEIKDSQGNTLFGDLGRVGQDLEFVGAAPYRVLLGYAPGVLLKFNAEPIALSPHTRNNVASLVLGQ